MDRTAVLTIVLALTTATLAGCIDTGNGGDDGGGGDGRTLTVGTEAGFPPFEIYYESNDTFAGFDIDLMREIGERMNATITFQNLEFTALIPTLEQGGIDAAISAMSITPERQEQVAFSDPYYQANQSVLVTSDSTIQTMEDLNQTGVTIGVQQGTVGADVATAMGNPTVSEFTSYPDAVAALKAGQVDAVIMDRPAQVQQAQQDAQLEIIFDIETDDNYGIAVAEDDIDLLNEINQALSDIKGDGTMQNLMDKWGV